MTSSKQCYISERMPFIGLLEYIGHTISRTHTKLTVIAANMDKRILVQEAHECVIPCVGVYGGRMVGYERLYNIV